jgi:hypothetical protein
MGRRGGRNDRGILLSGVPFYFDLCLYLTQITGPPVICCSSCGVR